MTELDQILTEAGEAVRQATDGLPSQVRPRETARHPRRGITVALAAFAVVLLAALPMMFRDHEPNPVPPGSQESELVTAAQRECIDGWNDSPPSDDQIDIDIVGVWVGTQEAHEWNGRYPVCWLKAEALDGSCQFFNADRRSLDWLADPPSTCAPDATPGGAVWLPVSNGEIDGSPPPVGCQPSNVDYWFDAETGEHFPEREAKVQWIPTVWNDGAVIAGCVPRQLVSPQPGDTTTPESFGRGDGNVPVPVFNPAGELVAYNVVLIGTVPVQEAIDGGHVPQFLIDDPPTPYDFDPGFVPQG